MLRSLREIKKELKNCKKAQAVDAEGRVVVDLRVINDNDFLSPYSTANHNAISEGVSDFIEHSLSDVFPEKPIHFRIYSDVITKEEQVEYTQAIHNHYADKYRQTCLEKKKLHNVAIIMALVAVAALSFMIGIDIAGLRTEVFTEIVDIFAWVFMWEAVDIFFLECTMLRFKQRRYLRLADSVIEYFGLNKIDKKNK